MSKNAERSPAAADETFNREVLDSVQTGDVVLFNRTCSEMGNPLGIGICLFAKWTSVYDHVGVVVRGKDDAEPQVLEAGFRGVTCKPLQQRLDRKHHDSVAVRHLLLDPTSSDPTAVRRRIEAFAKETDGAPYKHRLTDFLTTALQPPEKRAACDVFSAFNAAMRNDASLQHLAVTAKTCDPAVAFGASRRIESLRGEIEVLQASSMEHSQRLDRDLPAVVKGRQPSAPAGFVCSELIAEAYQAAAIADSFPTPMNFGAHDWSSLSAFTSADEVRHRRPPPLAPSALLGPELLLKKQPLAASEMPCAADPRVLVRSLESLGWSLESAAELAGLFRPMFLQRGETLQLGASLSGSPAQVVIPETTRLLVAERSGETPGEGCREGRLRVILPQGVALGLTGPAQQSAHNTKPATQSTASSAADTKNIKAEVNGAVQGMDAPKPERLAAIAEAGGFVWVADAGVCNTTAQRLRQEQQNAQHSSYDTRLTQLRRGQAPEGCEKDDPRAPHALYIVERGAVHDLAVDRVYRQGEVVGIDSFIAHLPASTLHGGWDGPILTARKADPPRPHALRDGTMIRRVAYGDVLSANGVRAVDAVDDGTGFGTWYKDLTSLLRRYAVFHSYCDSRAASHALNPTLVDRMDLAHRKMYFEMDKLPVLGARLLDTVLFQGRDDDTILFSDVVRVEETAKAAADLLAKKGVQKPEAQAALYFLGRQASHDGCTVSITNINDGLHALYRGRSDAPYISLKEPKSTGDQVLDDFLSDANRMSRKMIFAELLDLCSKGAVIVPLSVAIDCATLVKHLAYVATGDAKYRDPVPATSADATTASAEAESPTPEQFFDEDLVKTIRGEAWDLSTSAKLGEFLTRFGMIVAAATVFNVALFPLQFAAYHRMIFGSQSPWTLRRVLSPKQYLDLLTHTVHGIALRRTALGLAVSGLYAAAMRPPAPLFDPFLDDLPKHPHWESLKFGLGVTAVATLITYPLDVAVAHGAYRSAEQKGGAAAINFYTSQTTVHSALRTAYTTHGVRGLFRGLHLAPFAAVPFFGAHWVWYHEFLLPLFIDKRYAPSAVDGRRPKVDEWYATSSTAAILWKTGVVGWAYLAHTILAHPFETVRYASMATQVSPSVAFKNIVTTCGYNPLRVGARLYQGWATGIVRAVPMMFGSFALTGVMLTDYHISMPPSVRSKIRQILQF